MAKEFKEVIDSYRHDEHEHCIASEMVQEGFSGYSDCGSSDGLSLYSNIYEDDTETFSAYCFSCAQSFQQKHLSKSTLADQLGLDPEDGKVREKKTFERKPKQPKITREQRDELWSRTSNEGKGYRGLSDESLKFYGFRVELKKNQKDVKAVYFPETKDGKLQGYKSRHDPKGFGWDNIGITGAVNDLSGQYRFPDGGKYVLITGGEFDMVAAQDMLYEYQSMKNQDDYNRYAVVSPTTGESSAAKQCRNHYEWFDKFDVIVVGLDADSVGREAALKLAEVLPKEKVRIATWSGGKDPNQMLQDGKQRQFWSDFFGAKELIASGITSSVNLMESIREALKRPRIPMPHEMEKLQDMTKGDGLICNRIYNLIGDTSVKY
ncbi:toprim-like protein [Vibrio phage 1.161.O._10N.261.48.C5]|nr:toprim-like protein [Vibrio phage 1.161.O._10N.261.48.C5]